MFGLTVGQGLVFVVFIAVLAINIFGLDTIMCTGSHQPRPSHKRFCGSDEVGMDAFTDPDGRPLHRTRRN